VLGTNRLSVLFFLFPLALAGQTGGVMAEWDLRKALQSMAADAARLKPVLEQLKPQEWVAKGAPDTYRTQLESAQTQIEGVTRSTEILAKDPEKLTAALDTFLRLQALESVLNSLAEGVRNYQNPALADLLGGFTAQQGANRQGLQHYLTGLAATKEQELEIADKEAQRCRGILSRQPPAKKR
jgi:hypothetical protein